jgi:urease beta subunit
MSDVTCDRRTVLRSAGALVGAPAVGTALAGDCPDTETTRLAGRVVPGDAAVRTHRLRTLDTCELRVDLSGPGDADLDLYLTLDGRQPTTTDYDLKSWTDGSDERVVVDGTRLEAGKEVAVRVEPFRGGGEYELSITERGVRSVDREGRLRLVAVEPRADGRTVRAVPATLSAALDSVDAGGPDREHVRLENDGDGPVDAAEYTLADGDGHRLDLPDVEVPAGYDLLVVSGRETAPVVDDGHERVTVGWPAEDVWDDDGDRARLFAAGDVVDRLTYGDAAGLGVERVRPVGEDESVTVVNGGDRPVDLSGYALVDRDGHRYEFDRTLGAGETLQLFTLGRGDVDPDQVSGDQVVFWNRITTVWDREGGRAALVDPEGEVLDRYEYDGRGEDEGDLSVVAVDATGEDEAVVLRNGRDRTVELAGYTVGDAGGESFEFGYRLLGPGRTLKLFTRSRAAVDGAAMTGDVNVFRGRPRSVWDRSGDTVTLADAEGEVIDRYEY